MPNGFHNDPSIDLIFHRHSEHGHFHFKTHRSTAGQVVVHLDHARGYAYEPRWDTLDLAPLVRGQRRRPTRADMEAVAAELVARLVALQASNPASVCRPDRASAFLVLDGWYVVFGRYYTYTRAPGGALAYVEPPIGSRTDDMLRQFIAAEPTHHYLARDTHVFAGRGLMYHAPGECVYDLEGVGELLASTVALHEHPAWPGIAGAPLDAIEAAGRLVAAMRDEAIAHGNDHVAIRWRAPPTR